MTVAANLDNVNDLIYVGKVFSISVKKKHYQSPAIDF